MLRAAIAMLDSPPSRDSKWIVRIRVSAATVSHAVQPVVAQVHPQEGQPPGPGRVPGQLQQAVILPHVYVSRQLEASHEHSAGRVFCVTFVRYSGQ